jgi:hypothetical protein
MIEKNPFAPEIERVPLLLTLDARSFQTLTGTAREEAEYLCQLCWTDGVDGLWSWEGNPIVSDIPQTEIGPIENGSRTVRRVGEPKPGFIGGVFCWSQFPEWADQCGYNGAERDWFVYYASLNHFHSRNGRHYLVTADDRLLRESEAEKGWFRRGQPDTRIRSVSGALFLAGLAMKAHGQIFYNAPQPGHSIYTSKQSMYEYLARDFIEPQWRLLEALRKDTEDPKDLYRSEREALVEGILDRVVDILRARDRIALANARDQDAEALDEIRYDLRSMIASSAGAIDSLAVLAHIAFPFHVDSDARVSLRFPEFRKCLKAHGGVQVAEIAGSLMPFMRFLWALRNPVFHKHGLPGHTVHYIGQEPNRSKITLSIEQVELLKKLLAHRGEATDGWGIGDLNVKGLDPNLDPWVFTQHLASASIGAIQRLTKALADDCEAPASEAQWDENERRAIQCFRRLSGFSLKEVKY